MRIIFTLFLLVGFLQACSVKHENPCSLSEDVRKGLHQMDSLRMDPLSKQRYTTWLKCNYDEPSILMADHEIYRWGLDCSGSGQYSKIVRVEQLDDGSYTAVIKEFEGSTGSPETKGSVYVFELPVEDWDALKNFMALNNFWTYIDTCNVRSLHGCTWYIEGYNPVKHPCTKKNYHRIGGCYPVDPAFVAMYDFFRNLNEQ